MFWVEFSRKKRFSLQRIYERIEKSLLSIQNFLGVDFPLEKLDIVALPNFSTVKPADNWGLIVYK